MRNEPNLRIERLRRVHPTLGGSPAGANWGYFEHGALRIISSGDGDPWEHVSVSCADRCPTWHEMAWVVSLFWEDDETVVQFHPRKDRHINAHPYCLHLWKRRNEEFVLPPSGLIA